MRGASFRDAALADITVDDVRAMLDLNESLFVEHKGRDPVVQLAKAMSSFANQLGGWVLVNIADEGKPRPLGPLGDWATAQSPIDVVRDRIAGLVASMPPFEAKAFTLDHTEPDVLVVRVYESADTPHIVNDGAIYVRGFAQDRRSDKWEARPIENPAILRELVRRGEQSADRVAGLLRPRTDLPLANDGISLRFAETRFGLIPHEPGAIVCARVAPLTLPARFAGWAQSRDAVNHVADDLLPAILGVTQHEVQPHSQGFVVRGTAGANWAPRTESSGRSLAGPVAAAVDAVGLVGVSARFAKPEPEEWTDPMTLEAGLGDTYLRSLIEVNVRLLEGASFLGRARVHLWILGLGHLLRIEDEGNTLKGVGPVPFETEVTLPTSPEELSAVARQAARAYGREGGLRSFE